MDPNNVGALQGRANCYYSIGQYQQALDDYQKVQALSPNPQLASMIQTLQTKVGMVGPAVPPLPGNPPGDSFSQGVAAYQQQQYAQAIPLFQKAVQENPNDSMAYYYLGLAQVQTGDLKDAAVALGISNKLKPDSSLETYVNQLKQKLSPDDQQWVDSQVQAGAKAEAPQAGHPLRKPQKYPRLFLGVAALSLPDFTANSQMRQTETRNFQKNDPTFQYSGAVPSLAADLGLEEDIPLSPEFEIGLMLNFMPAGSATDSITNSSGYSLTDSFNINAADFSVEARYYFSKEDFQPWIAAGPLFFGAYIDYAYNRKNSSGTVTFGGPGTFDGYGFGGQGQVGLDWHLGDSFVLSLVGGYQTGSASNFQGKLGNSISSGIPSGSQVQLMVVPDSQGNVIVPVANGLLCVPTYDHGVGAAAPSGTHPMSLDISGAVGGLTLAYYF